VAFSECEQSFCVLEYARTSSVVTVQRRFQAEFQKAAPVFNSIKKWYAKFRDEGCLCTAPLPGRPGPNETVNRIREAYQRSPCKSTTRASLELGVAKSTVWRILRKRLKCKSYRLQLYQDLSENDKDVRLNFCIEIQERFAVDGFADSLIFSDEATFHLSGKVNRHIVRIWETENPRVVIENVRDSPKVNVFCAISNEKLYGPFFFEEPTINGMICLHMLQNWLIPQLNEDSNDYIFQQDGFPANYHKDLRGYLNRNLPQRWIGRTGKGDDAFMWWPQEYVVNW